MLDWACCECIMWQTYRDRLREAQTNRLARQARAGAVWRFRFDKFM
jgi:hypothetical protein